MSTRGSTRTPSPPAPPDITRRFGRNPGSHRRGSSPRRPRHSNPVVTKTTDDRHPSERNRPPSSKETRMNSTAIHRDEAIVRLEAIEGGLARIVLGLQSADTLPAYIEMARIARRHLAAV